MSTSAKHASGTDAAGTPAGPTDESQPGISRRSLVAGGVAVGVGAGLSTFESAATALAKTPTSNKLSKGDAAILRFLSAAEILETDLWQQYNELGGIQDSEVPGGSGSG